MGLTVAIQRGLLFNFRVQTGIFLFQFSASDFGVDICRIQVHAAAVRCERLDVKYS
jgi:limonene-1,2-epoxide hydrolase